MDGYRPNCFVDRPKHLRACPVAVAKLLPELGRPTTRASLSHWRWGQHRVMRQTLQRMLKELDCAISAEELEDRIWANTGPGRKWQICCHVDEDIEGCPNVQTKGNAAPRTKRSRRATAHAPARAPAPPPNPIAARLDAAYERHEQLVILGKQTAEIDEEILELRRHLRRGPTLNAGEILGEGRFRLIAEIGHGGFGTVWKAYDKKEHDLVAIKVLHGQHSRDASLRERFFRGARKMAELSHPHIVRIIVPEGEQDGFHYYVMEYLAGLDLHRAVLEGTIDVGRSLAVVETIASALEAAHDKGLVHRDVKPHNILLREDDKPALTDFDLVLASGTTGGTRTSPLGTVLYAAPEQNEDASRVDHRVDIHGLGMTAVFCIYGKQLPQKSMFHRSAFLDELECSERLRAALRRAVAIDASERFESMEVFRTALAAARHSASPRRATPSQLYLPFYYRWARRIDDKTGLPASGALALSTLATLGHLLPLGISCSLETRTTPSEEDLLLSATIFVSQICLFLATRIAAEATPTILARGTSRAGPSELHRLEPVLLARLSDRRLVGSGVCVALTSVVTGLALGLIQDEQLGVAIVATLGASILGFTSGMVLAGLYGLVLLTQALVWKGRVPTGERPSDRRVGAGPTGRTSMVGAMLSSLITMTVMGRSPGDMVWSPAVAWTAWLLLVTALTQ